MSVFIIAEAGVNHNGSIIIAKKLISFYSGERNEYYKILFNL